MQLEQRKKTIINILYWALIAALIYMTFKYFIFYIMPFVLGLIIALALKPLIDWFSRKLRMKRRLAATINVAFFYIVIGSLITVLAFIVINYIAVFVAGLEKNYTTEIQPYLIKLLDMNSLDFEMLDPDFARILDTAYTTVTEALGGALKTLSGSVMSWATGVLTSVPTFLVNLLFTIISTFFIASDYGNISSFVLRQMQPRTASLMVQSKRLLGDVLVQFIRSYSLILGVTFIEVSVGLVILGVKNFLLIAFLIAIMDILPVVGTGLALIPWGVIELISGNLKMGIGILILYLIITIVRNIIEPKIVGNNVGLHPLMTLMSMYVGAQLFGGLGLFGFPIGLSILRILNEKGAIHLYKSVDAAIADDSLIDQPNEVVKSSPAAQEIQPSPDTNVTVVPQTQRQKKKKK